MRTPVHISRMIRRTFRNQSWSNRLEETGTVVIGASQAGLATSYELSREGVEHIVLERKEVGNGWHQRWDSFCLVTPNWSVRLPGSPYDGGDPDGFMTRDEIAGYLQRYASSFNAPVREEVNVLGVKRDDKGFVLEASDGRYRAESLVLATGAFQKPHIPETMKLLPKRLTQLDLSEYSNPAALPDGDVLLVGSGQSGCQLAEELVDAGRRVVLACGRAPWFYRRVGDHDLVWWAIESGFLDTPVDELPEAARLFANVLTTGHDGGHDLHLRTLQSLGVTLAGRYTGADGKTAHFANDLAESVAWGDEKHGHLKHLFLEFAKQRGMAIPDLPDPEPFVADPPDKIDLSSFGSVVLTGGYRPDFSSWLPWPEAFDDYGFPYQQDGVSTVVDGLHFVGLHFLRKRKSSLLYGVGEDAEIVAQKISQKVR